MDAQAVFASIARAVRVAEQLRAIGGEQVANTLAMFFTFPIICAFLASLFAAAYISYRDVFEPPPAAEPAVEPAPQ